MRIIAGEAKGRRLRSPAGRTTRPILDSLKERLFSIVAERLVDAVVWDLFAGAGSIGLESLSRGASSCIFVEKDRSSHAVLTENVELLGYGDRARALRGDALRPERFAAESRPDLVFLDPPFPLVEREPAVLGALLGRIASEYLEPQGLIVIRVPERLEWPAAPEGVRMVDCRRQGVNRIEMYEVVG